MTRRLLLLVPVLALTACGGGSSSGGAGGASVAAAGPASAQTATIVGDQQLRFVPDRVTAKVGTLKLTLENEGGVPHNLQFADASVGRPIPTGSGTQTGTFVFTKPGTYSFVCTIHDGMDGEVDVTAT